jgi:hypothetical protein
MAQPVWMDSTASPVPVFQAIQAFSVKRTLMNVLPTLVRTAQRVLMV